VLGAPVWLVYTRRRNIFIAFAGGSILGGITSGLVLWLGGALLAWIPTVVAATAIAAAGVLAVLRDVDLLDFPLPENRRQIPRQIFSQPPLRASLKFGFELGTGARTYVSATAPYVLAIALLLGGGSLGLPLFAGVGFGLGRTSMLAQRFWASNAEESERRLLRSIRWLVPASGAAVAVSGLVLVAPR